MEGAFIRFVAPAKLGLLVHRCRQGAQRIVDFTWTNLVHVSAVIDALQPQRLRKAFVKAHLLERVLNVTRDERSRILARCRVGMNGYGSLGLAQSLA